MLLTREPKPVVVVDPSPEFTAAMLADKIKSNRVYEAPIYWNVFASALLDLVRKACDLDKIDRAYDLAGIRML